MNRWEYGEHLIKRVEKLIQCPQPGESQPKSAQKWAKGVAKTKLDQWLNLILSVAKYFQFHTPPWVFSFKF